MTAALALPLKHYSILFEPILCHFRTHDKELDLTRAAAYQAHQPVRLALCETAFNNEPISPVDTPHQAVRLETFFLMQPAVADEIFHKPHSLTLELNFARISPFFDLRRSLPVQHRMIRTLHVVKVGRLSHLLGLVPELLQCVDWDRPETLPVSEDVGAVPLRRGLEELLHLPEATIKESNTFISHRLWNTVKVKMSI